MPPSTMPPVSSSSRFLKGKKEKNGEKKKGEKCAF
jgi:hypothetical protein